MTSVLSASYAPARGAPISDVIFASGLGLGILVLVFGLGALYVRGRLPALDRLADWSERKSGLPAWAAIRRMLSSLPPTHSACCHRYRS